MCSKVYDRQLTQTDSKRSLNWLKWTHSSALRRLFYSTKPIYATHMLPWHPSSSKEFWWNSTGALYYSLRNLKKKTHIILYQFCFLLNKLLLVKWIILNEGTSVQNRRTIKLYWCGPTSKWRENLTLYEFDCVCVNLTEKIGF